MTSIQHAAAAFLAGPRIAVTGVSRSPKGHGGNTIFQRLRDRGYDVVPVNPNADAVEGVTCYHRLSDVPGPVDGVVVAARPDTALATMQECADLGIRQVWLHRAFGAGSVDPAATEYGRAHGITVIDGGCPLMFQPVTDPGHRLIKLFVGRRMPKEV